MASFVNVLTKNTSTNQGNFEIITLSSDEEESEESNNELNFLFNRFILACRPYVTKEAVKDALSLFTEVQGKLSTTQDLLECLKRYGKEIGKGNAHLYLSLVVKALKDEKSGSKSDNSTQSKAVCNHAEKLDKNKVTKCVSFCDVSEAREFERSPTTKTSSSNSSNAPSTSSHEIATISDDDDFESNSREKVENKNRAFDSILREKIGNMPSTSTAHEAANKDEGKVSAKTLTEKQKKKLAGRLKLRLKEISNKIKILNRAELTLEEMDMHDSTYIQESRLKKKFEKTWNKLCKILGRPPNTGRVVEKPVRISSTGYSMIDKAIAKFLKEKNNSFPDYFDIRDIVLDVNKKHDLRMSTKVLNGIIADIFTDIGNKLQRRRERDLLYNFGSHLLDDFSMENDPALSNEELAHQLHKNRKISKHNLKKVYAKYTHLERYEQDDKSRRPGPSRGREDASTEESSSDDEHDRKGSKNRNKQARLARKEVLGKLRKPRSSRGIDEDITDEPSSSGDERDDLRMKSDNLIVIEDVPSSQDLSPIHAKPATSSDMSLSASHVEGSSGVLLSDSERPDSPTFPLTCHSSEENETEQAMLTTVQNTAIQSEFSSDDVELILGPEKKQLGKSVNKPSVNETLVSELHQSTDANCKVVNKQRESDEHVTVSPNRVNELLSSNTNDCKVSTDPKEQNQVCKPAYECTVIDADLAVVQNQREQLVTTKHDVKHSISDPQPRIDDDCQVVNNPQEQLGKPAYEPTVIDDDLAVVQKQREQLASTKHDVEHSVSDHRLRIDKDCLAVNGEKQFNITVDQPTIDDTSEVVHNVKQHSETMDLDEPNSPSVARPHQNTNDDCLIIDDDDKEAEAIKSSEKQQLKIPTSSPSEELSKTLNTLREIFRTRSKPFEQAKAPYSYDESGNVNLVSQAAKDTASSSEDSTLNEMSFNPVTRTVTAKTPDHQAQSVAAKTPDECVSDTSCDMNACSNFEQDDDVVMFDKKQCPDSNINLDRLPCFPEVKGNKSTPKIDEPPKHSGIDPTNIDHARSPIRSKITSLSPLKQSSSSDGVNSRKRKATTELKVEIPKFSVKCLEHIAMALKNKRLKLPDCWVNSGEETGNSAGSKPTTSKESSAVGSKNTSALPKSTASKESPAISHILTLNENNSEQLENKAKVSVQHRQVFREKTLNALKTSAKPVCSNNNLDGFARQSQTPSPVISSISLLAADTEDNSEECEIIVIDD